MDPARIEELYRYNRWANARVRGAAAALSADDFTRDLKNSFPSVRDTLAHIYGAEWIWLQRWNGVSPPRLPLGAEFPTLTALEGRWSEVEREQAELVARLTRSALERPLSYTNTKGQPFAYPLWRTLLHVVNHSSYHRGQITTMLRQLGARPASTDLLVFYDQTNGRQPGRTS